MNEQDKKNIDNHKRVVHDVANDEVRKYMSFIGRKGGKSGTGKSKSRGSEHAKKAAESRWSKNRMGKSEIKNQSEQKSGVLDLREGVHSSGEKEK